MAVPFAPWIPGPQNVAGQLTEGLRIGEEETRLRLEQERAERDMYLKQQQLAQETAYNQQSLGLRQQEITQQKQLNDIKVQEAARTYAAQQKFSQWMQQNPDKDPAIGMMMFFPGTGEAMTGYGQLARQSWLSKQALRPPQFGEYTTSEGRKIPYATFTESTGGTGIRWGPQERATSARGLSMRIRGMQSEVRGIEKSMDSMPMILAKRAHDKAVAGEKLTPTEQKAADSYAAAQDRLETLNDDIDRAETALDYGEEFVPSARTRGGAGSTGLSWDPNAQKWVGGAAGAAPATPTPPRPPARAAAAPGMGGQIATGIMGNAMQPIGAAASNLTGGFQNPYTALGRLGHQALGLLSPLLQQGRPIQGLPQGNPPTGPIIPPGMPPAQGQAQAAMLRNFQQGQGMGQRQGGMMWPSYLTNPPVPVDTSVPPYLSGGANDQFVPYNRRTGLPPYLTEQMGD
jgi:hypothetical protein